MPGCVRKCPYCDFNSHVAPESLPEDRYIDRLIEDLEFDLPHVRDRQVQSIFFGGGTPSLFAPRSIARLLNAIRVRLPLATDTEITLEANPGTIEHGRFAAYREAGVTRISMGAQSFSDHQLKVLGRIHAREHIFDAVAEIKAAGFKNFNLALMYGLTAQSLADALDDIEQAIELAPTHLSHYQLALEPGTVFFHRPPSLPDDETIWEMQVECQARLAARGYAQYEISAYARTGFQCRHNLNYWEFGDYLGIGAGAHGKWTDAAEQKIFRRERRRQPREYLSERDAAKRVVATHELTRDDLSFEFMLNTLRLLAGFSQRTFEIRTGLEFAAIELALAQAVERGLIEYCSDEFWRVTSFGRQFLNDLQTMFLAVGPASKNHVSVRLRGAISEM